MFSEKEKGLNTALRNFMDSFFFEKNKQCVRLVIYLWNTNTKIVLMLLLKTNLEKIIIGGHRL